MAEPEEKPPVSGEDEASSSDEFVNAPQDVDASDDVPQLETHDDEQDEDEGAEVEEEAVELQDQPARVDTSSLRVVQEMQADGSELSSMDASSVDALPRRVGSPLDSVLSGPDDAPSVQVCCGSAECWLVDTHQNDSGADKI